MGWYPVAVVILHVLHVCSGYFTCMDRLKPRNSLIRLAGVQTGVQTGPFLSTALMCTNTDITIKSNVILGTVHMVDGHKYMLTQQDETKDVFVSDHWVVWNSEE
jgi:hypothetical protein